MNSRVQIIFNRRVDRPDVESVLPGVYAIDVIDRYSGGESVVTLDAGALDSTYLEALHKVLDAATFLIEESAFVWKITFKDGYVNLEDSYLRDTVSTNGKPALDDGTALKVRFDVPGFETSYFREIDLWYNQDFNPTDLESLEEIGITLDGNGASFLVMNEQECKISFSVPEGAGTPYVIDFDSIDVVVPIYVP